MGKENGGGNSTIILTKIVCTEATPLKDLGDLSEIDTPKKWEALVRGTTWVPKETRPISISTDRIAEAKLIPNVLTAAIPSEYWKLLPKVTIILLRSFKIIEGELLVTSEEIAYVTESPADIFFKLG